MAVQWHDVSVHQQPEIVCPVTTVKQHLQSATVQAVRVPTTRVTATEGLQIQPISEAHPHFENALRAQ